MSAPQRTVASVTDSPRPHDHTSIDLTKVWPHADYPLHEVGRMTLDRNPANFFAEIEQAIVSGLYAAHAEQRPLDTDLLMAEIRGTRPLSVLMAEQVAALRAWALERTVPAD